MLCSIAPKPLHRCFKIAHLECLTSSFICPASNNTVHFGNAAVRYAPTAAIGDSFLLFEDYMTFESPPNHDASLRAAYALRIDLISWYPLPTTDVDFLNNAKGRSRDTGYFLTAEYVTCANYGVALNVVMGRSSHSTSTKLASNWHSVYRNTCQHRSHRCRI